MFHKKGVLKILCKNQRKIPVPESFFDKSSEMLKHRCYFPVNFAKILRTLFLVNTSGGYFFQMSPNVKRGRTENTQYKNQLKTKQNSNSKLF